jgi:hypothetical protein
VNQVTLFALLAVGAFIWWKMRKDREPAVIGEVIVALRNYANARHESIGTKYAVMADAISEGQAYAARGEQPSPNEFRRIGSAIGGATESGLLEHLGFFQTTGRQGHAREALFRLMKKLGR